MSFIGVFSILKYKTLVLKTTTWWTRASHFVDGWRLLRYQIRLFPHSLCGWPCDFCGGGGYEWFSLGKNFFPNLWSQKFFPCHITVSALYTSWAIFFSVQDIIFHSYILASCFPSKLVCRIFFLKLFITPSKVKCSSPKIHQTFAQLADSDMSIISKAFWNNRGQNFLRERGGIRFYLTLPGESVRTYGDVITKFSRMDSKFSQVWSSTLARFAITEYSLGSIVISINYSTWNQTVSVNVNAFHRIYM